MTDRPLHSRNPQTGVSLNKNIRRGLDEIDHPETKLTSRQFRANFRRLSIGTIIQIRFVRLLHRVQYKKY